MKFAVQLYSVRDHIKDGNDMLEVLGNRNICVCRELSNSMNRFIKNHGKFIIFQSI